MSPANNYQTIWIYLAKNNIQFSYTCDSQSSNFTSSSSTFIRLTDELLRLFSEQVMGLLQKPRQALHQVIAAFWAVYEQIVIATAIRNPLVLFRYIHEGTKKRDPIPGLRRANGSIAKNDELVFLLFSLKTSVQSRLRIRVQGYVQLLSIHIYIYNIYIWKLLKSKMPDLCDRIYKANAVRKLLLVNELPIRKRGQCELQNVRFYIIA